MTARQGQIARPKTARTEKGKGRPVMIRNHTRADGFFVADGPARKYRSGGGASLRFAEESI